MSTTLLDTEEVTVTRFYGGKDRGCMVQIYNKKTGTQTERPATEIERAHPGVEETELEFSEAQVRAALEEHGPTVQECGLCGQHTVCDCDFTTPWTTDHVIEALKKASQKA